jgi:large subunit ribosomal protein L30
MTALRLTQIRSAIGGTTRQRQTLRTLGLRHIGDVALKPDEPQFRGIIRAVAHLLTVEEVDTP